MESPRQPDTLRRGMLAVAATVGLVPFPARALSPVFMIIGPSIAAGIMALLGIKMQRDLDVQRHADDLAMSRAKLRIELDRLAHDRYTAARDERMFVIRTLLENDEEFRTSALEQMRMSLAVLPGSRHLLTAGLLENVDGHATRIGLHAGRIAVERAGNSGFIDNELALALADGGYVGQELPLPVDRIVRDLNERTTERHREAFAQQLGMPVRQVTTNWALAGERRLTRARRPTGSPDIVAAAFMPKGRQGTVRYAIQRA